MWAVAHLANFPFGMSAKTGRGEIPRHLRHTYNIPFCMGVSIEVPEETAPLLQLTTEEPIEVVSWMLDGVPTASGSGIDDLPLLAVCFPLASVA